MNNSRVANIKKEILPDGWTATALGQTIQLSREKIKPENIRNEKYVGLEHIESNTGIVKYGESSNVRSTKSVFKKGDILYGRLRPYLNKVCIPSFDGICSTDILVLMTYDFLTPKFLCLYLRTTNFVQFATSQSQGVNLPRVKFSTIKDYPLPLPPVNEQNRIVSKIESIFTQIDTLEESLKSIKCQMSQYKQLVLKLAFEGRLASQDLNDTSAQGLKTIEKFDEEIRLIKSNLIKTDVPEKWIITTIGHAVTLSKEKFKPQKTNKRKYIGLEHIEPNTGTIINYGNSSRVRSTKNVFKKGNVLYGRLRPYLNKVCMPNFGGVCSTDILVLIPNESLDPMFFSLYLRTADFVQFSDSRSQGVNLPRVKFSTIASYPLLLPPYNEQKRIVSKIESIFVLVDTVDARVARLLEMLATLRQSVLKHAFEGKLVPQDPHDEPAIKLLEKIRGTNDG